MSQIITKNINLGGIADSDYLGNQNSVAECVGLDIHGEAGIIKLNQKLTNNSGSVVDEFCKARVSSKNGSTYFFGVSGGIFERESNGTWTDRGTTSPSAGSAGVMSAWEYQGYIYYAMQSRLGRIATPSAGGSWAGRDDSWKTFTNTDADFHPMWEVSQVLYIGDAHFVAQVDAGVFSANALDLKTGLRIKSLGNIDTDLLIGTYVAENVMRTEIIRWNTWSVSYSVTDPIPEIGINAFLDTDNLVIVSAGTKGNLYVYDGVRLDFFKNIKGAWSSTNKATIHPQACFNFNGLPLFGLSQVTGTGVNLGVYSLGSTSRGYPVVLNLEFKISEGVLTGIEIGAITAISADQFLVSWKRGTTYGVDILDLTAKQTSGYFVLRNILVDREKLSNYGLVHVPYRTLPASTDIKVYHNKNHAGFTQFDATTEMVTDTDRLVRHSKVDVGQASVCTVKVELTANVNDSPEVEMLIMDVT